MMKSKRFEPIREIASTSAKDLSRAMGEAGRKVADLEGQFEQLQSYRDEYLRNSRNRPRPIDAVKLQNYPIVSGSPRRGIAPAIEVCWTPRARSTRSGARCGAKSASRPNRSAGWWIDFARKRARRGRREQREGDDAALRASVAARGETGNH